LRSAVAISKRALRNSLTSHEHVRKFGHSPRPARYTRKQPDRQKPACVNDQQSNRSNVMRPPRCVSQLYVFSAGRDVRRVACPAFRRACLRQIASMFSPTLTAANTYYYDGQRVLAEYSVAPGSGQTGSSVIRYFVDGPTYIDEHLMMFDRVTGKKYYYLDQELHTVAALVDSQLNVAESATYDAYGKVTIRDASDTPAGDASDTPVDESPIGNPYHFTSRRRDHLTAWFSPNDLNQYHYRARTYNPTLGRFLQRDPLDYIDSMNLYEYVASRPTVATDPFGLQQSMQGVFRDMADRNPNPDTSGTGKFNTDSIITTGLFFGGYYQSGNTIAIGKFGLLRVRSGNLWPFGQGTNLEAANCVLRKLGFTLPVPENGIYWAGLDPRLDGFTISGTGAFFNRVAASFVADKFDMPPEKNKVFLELLVTLNHELAGHNRDEMNDGPALVARYETPVRQAWTRKSRRKIAWKCCKDARNKGVRSSNELESIMCSCKVKIGKSNK
jgi:RHS repeat-associated protein